MGTYINKSNVEALFGTDNVATWSNLDNDDAQANEARIDDAIAYAEALIDDRFRDGKYAVPLVGNSTNALETIKNVAAQFAGWWLYRARGLRDDETEADKMATQQEEANEVIDGYLSGRTKLDAVLTKTQPTAPVVVL